MREREREGEERERFDVLTARASLLRVRLRRLFRVDVCKERGLLLLLTLRYYLRARARWSRVVPSVPKGKRRALLLLPFYMLRTFHAYQNFSFFANETPNIFLNSFEHFFCFRFHDTFETRF